MAVSMTAGDVWVVHTDNSVAAAANLADKSLVDVSGAAIANAANACYGVVAKDTKSGDYLTIKIAPSIVEVIATGTVTKGSYVEALQATVYANIEGTSTATTSCGVTNLSSGYPLGKALSASDANGSVLVALLVNQAKPT
jgi:hypothetical protein